MEWNNSINHYKKKMKKKSYERLQFSIEIPNEKEK